MAPSSAATSWARLAPVSQLHLMVIQRLAVPHPPQVHPAAEIDKSLITSVLVSRIASTASSTFLLHRGQPDEDLPNREVQALISGRALDTHIAALGDVFVTLSVSMSSVRAAMNSTG
jgi:hypothetical protein